MVFLNFWTAVCEAGVSRVLGKRGCLLEAAGTNSSKQHAKGKIFIVK